MIKSYFKIAFRNLFNNKVSSFINIFGLSIGMAVAILIGLWIWDELSYNKYHQHYDRIAEVWQNSSSKQGNWTFEGTPIPLATELRNSYPEDFKYVSTFAPASFLMSLGIQNCCRTEHTWNQLPLRC